MEISPIKRLDIALAGDDNAGEIQGEVSLQDHSSPKDANKETELCLSCAGSIEPA